VDPLVGSGNGPPTATGLGRIGSAEEGTAEPSLRRDPERRNGPPRDPGILGLVPDHDVISVTREGSVATLWLDRAEARNALGPAFWAQLPSAVTQLGADPEVRAVVLAARGPHFSVGLDLKASASGLLGAGSRGSSEHPGGGSEEPPSPALRTWRTRAEVLRMQASVTSLADCPKPVIAAVHGYCIGGGLDLIACCDIRLATADAIFSLRETKMAMVADLGSLQRLPGIIGSGALAELAYTAKDIDARRAEQIGLVNAVHPDTDALHRAAAELAAEIAANPPLAVQGTKAVLRACRDRSVAEGLDYVALWNAGMLQADDLGEALSAFIEKRAPMFRGR
jgi:enoyl-CoA hydratase